jgi:hypothetical protein
VGQIESQSRSRQSAGVCLTAFMLFLMFFAVAMVNGDMVRSDRTHVDECRVPFIALSFLTSSSSPRRLSPALQVLEATVHSWNTTTVAGPKSSIMQFAWRWAPCQMTSLSCACYLHTANCRRRLRHDSSMTLHSSRLGWSSPSCADA